MYAAAHGPLRCLLAALLLLACTAQARAQQGTAYPLDQVEILLSGGVPVTTILERLRRDGISFRVDSIAERRLRTAGADSAFIQALRSVPYRGPVTPPPPPPPPPPPAATRTSAPAARYSPGGAAVRSLLIPGLGQFYTGRPALGVLFLGAGAGAIAAGVMSKRTVIECLERTTGTCPDNRIRDSKVERPMLLPGIGGFVALGVIGAIEASAAARRANARAGGGGDNTIGLLMPHIQPRHDGAVDLRFRLPF
jgi:hypothetical protein